MRTKCPTEKKRHVNGKENCISFHYIMCPKNPNKQKQKQKQNKQSQKKEKLEEE